MKREVVELVCDFCGLGENSGRMVETHRAALDLVAYDAEACERCWAKTLETFAVFAKSGRAVPPRTKIKRDAVAFPGTAWKFSSHAMRRLGERKIDPVELLKAIDRPDVTRPGNSADLEIRERGRLKAVVAPDRLVIITAAHHDEDDRAVMP